SIRQERARSRLTAAATACRRDTADTAPPIFEKTPFCRPILMAIDSFPNENKMRTLGSQRRPEHGGGQPPNAYCRIAPPACANGITQPRVGCTAAFRPRRGGHPC